VQACRYDFCEGLSLYPQEQQRGPAECHLLICKGVSGSGAAKAARWNPRNVHNHPRSPCIKAFLGRSCCAIAGRTRVRWHRCQITSPRPLSMSVSSARCSSRKRARSSADPSRSTSLPTPTPLALLPLCPSPTPVGALYALPSTPPAPWLSPLSSTPTPAPAAL
jgi:hypothetical protein